MRPARPVCLNLEQWGTLKRQARGISVKSGLNCSGTVLSHRTGRWLGGCAIRFAGHRRRRARRQCLCLL
jgi:hypothetical protein